MDVVYLVRKGDSNPELRYSLRSLANLPHRQVWLVGHCPGWVTGVRHIPTVQTGTKYRNTTLAVRRACENRQITDDFALFNDDFFVMRPLDHVPTMHLGPVEQRIEHHRSRGSTGYATGAERTAHLLRSWGYDEVLSYETHTPMVINRRGMLDALHRAAPHGIPTLHKRTLYGTLHQVGGALLDPDPKVTTDDPGPWHGPFLSTDDQAFRRHPVGEHIRATFPTPCRYEVDSP